MKDMFQTLAGGPPIEDSEDLTDDEIEVAVETRNVSDLSKCICDDLKQSHFTVEGHELRRRGDHLYWRVRLVKTQEPDRVLVFRVDWLQEQHVIE